MKTALVIVDIQNFYFPGGSLELVNAEQASVAAKEILQSFRDQKQLVVHVRHKSKRGLEIHENVEPLPGEKVITKEEINSFLRTDLLEYLQEHRINRLVVIGMQTQMCLQGAVRAAHDYGFECIVIQDACATRDVKFGNNIAKAEDVQTTVLATLIDGGFSKVIDLKEFNTNLEKYLFQKL
ncbi:MAG: cysteine hydrolase [Ignavibacteriae bacterium]|nr:MAG: cysteine hydrolase [Ignavibacteriota bacterium]